MAQPFREVVQVPVAGGRLPVAVAGPPLTAGAPVVLGLHGITGSHRFFSPVARHLDDRITLLVPDLRGRGAATGLPGPFGFAAHIDDLVALLHHLAVSRAVVAGHSMGAYVATRLAAAVPDRVAAAVLIDGGLALPTPTGVDADEVLAGLLGPALARLSMGFASVAAYREFWRAHPAFAGAWNDDLVDFIDYYLGPPVDGVFRSRVSEAAVRTDGRDLLDGDAARKALAAVSCPAVLLWAPRGLGDEPRPLLPPAVRAEAGQLVPHLVVRELPDTNHYLIMLRDRDARLVAAEIGRRALD